MSGGWGVIRLLCTFRLFFSLSSLLSLLLSTLYSIILLLGHIHVYMCVYRCIPVFPLIDTLTSCHIHSFSLYDFDCLSSFCLGLVLLFLLPPLQLLQIRSQVSEGPGRH